MSFLRIVKKFNKILTTHQKVRVFELMILMIIGGFLETFSVSLMIPFMNAVMEPEKTMEEWYVRYVCEIFNITDITQFLVFIAVVLAIIYVLKNFYLMLEYNLQYRFVYGNMFAMQEKILNVFIHRPYEYFLMVNSGEVIRIVNSDTIEGFNLLITLLSLMTELVVSAMLIITILVINPVATVCIAMLMLVMLAGINYVIKPKLHQAAIDNQNSGTGMNKWMLQSIQGIKELKVMGKEDFFIENYRRYGRVHVETNKRHQVLGIYPRFIIEAFSMTAMFIVVAVMIYSGVELESVIPLMTAIALAAMRLLPSINRISSAMAMMAYNEPKLDKMMENMEDVSKVSESLITDEIHDSTGEIHNLSDKIEFRGVTYHYPETDKNVLTDVDFTIEKGESVGIVGASGAGKTTAVDIVLGLLEPQNGAITVDGVNIRKDRRGWLNQIGYIPQAIFMLDDTIRANVAFGEKKEDISDDAVWIALKEASLDEYVRSLPRGLDTEIGERGMRLSGGQRQRIGIARALYYNPDVLIFDEATSALDNETESAIMDSINQLHGRKTMIIIAHRLTTIESCDHILRVADEKISRER